MPKPPTPRSTKRPRNTDIPGKVKRPARLHPHTTSRTDNEFANGKPAEPRSFGTNRLGGWSCR